eukprot:TRINITY_DN81867_c0_g1_i1.p1 TRINITY_DN81867_c0_g1~~TRINITY_DN81867_c0_g1_i1.p1  ORF type:complete len:425 (+),score=76.06 TRINITY_DN81867_c0_g1_i1:83-1357(+)
MAPVLCSQPLGATRDVCELRGVNLGGWLVLEKWITPSLFEEVAPDAEDERSLFELAGEDAWDEVTEHRDTFITEDDFRWMRSVGGLTAVRLPVGFWCLPEHAAGTPFIPTVQYVDKVFDWAEAHDLKVILELHGAAGSQNAKDHSGSKENGTEWLQGHNRKLNLQVLQAWAKRWGRRPSLAGFGIGNEVEEPEKNEDSMWPWSIIEDKIPSCKLGKPYWEQVVDFYEAATKACRPHMRHDVPFIVDTCWDMERWSCDRLSQLAGPVWLDFHHYECFGEEADVGTHCEAAKLQEALDEAVLPVIIGEFSLALRPSAPGYHDDDGWQRRFFNTQTGHAARQAAGWFFWTYRMGREGWPHWSYRESVELGWIEPDLFQEDTKADWQASSAAIVQGGHCHPAALRASSRPGHRQFTHRRGSSQRLVMA